MGEGWEGGWEEGGRTRDCKVNLRNRKASEKGDEGGERRMGGRAGSGCAHV